MAEQRLIIEIRTWHHCSVPDGSTYALYEESQGLGIYRFAPSGEAGAVEQWHLDADGYERFRQARPELALPAYKPRAPGTDANGNTLGKVVGPSAPAAVPAAAANPPVDPETAAEAETAGKVLDGIQLGLDVVGLIPGFGEFADLANVGISAARGDWLGASLSLAAAMPFAGWFATGAKVTKRVAAEAAAKTAKNLAEEAAKQAAKHGDDVAEQIAKHGDEAADAAKGGKVEGKSNKPRTEPANLAEQLALAEAKSGAGERILQGQIKDPLYPEGIWAKMQHVHQSPTGQNIVIHYWENLQTGFREGFKFK